MLASKLGGRGLLRVADGELFEQCTAQIGDARQLAGGAKQQRATP